MKIGRRKKSIRTLDENVAVINRLDETDEFFGYCVEKYVKENA